MMPFFSEKISVYFWLHWVSVVAHELSSCGPRASELCALGLRCVGLVAPWHVGS